MKKAGLYLLLAFTLNFIGNILWFIIFILDEPIFGSNYWEEFTLIIIYKLNHLNNIISLRIITVLYRGLVSLRTCFFIE